LPREKPNSEYDKSLEAYWSVIINEFKPHVIHIHGTEYAHGLACMNSCPEQNYVISIQGLVSVSSEFYFAGIKPLELVKHITLHDLLRGETIFQERKKFERRGKLEREYIRKTKHIIGRTDWDYAHTKVLNSSIEYHLCNETLRSGFYTAQKWNIKEKQDFSIFLSQAGYPLKGLHQALRALAIVKRDYPKVHLKVAGLDITKSDNLRDRLRLGGYGSFIKSLIKKLGLASNITFTGSLGEIEMINEYRSTHLFLCPSSIENSSNSLAEAQLLGVPCIASFVGGLPSLVHHYENGILYRFEDHVTLAFQIMKIFEDEKLALYISQNGQTIAEKRHDRDYISSRMVEIYSEVLSV
jgi:glycosyltransferase involved in cell wall biosynthesis